MKYLLFMLISFSGFSEIKRIEQPKTIVIEGKLPSKRVLNECKTWADESGELHCNYVLSYKNSLGHTIKSFLISDEDYIYLHLAGSKKCDFIFEIKGDFSDCFTLHRRFNSLSIQYTFCEN